MRWLLWIFCLAFLSIGAKNSEPGLAGDAPLYANISMSIAESGDWFKLDPRVPDFGDSYHEHPHLSFWLQAVVFEVFGAADWSARILGHLYYLAFLFLFFLALQKLCSTAASVFGVLILWILAPFTNIFSTFLLDPAALFWGFLFLCLVYKATFLNSKRQAVYAGLSLGACALSKGAIIAPFCVPAAFVGAVVLWQQKKKTKESNARLIGKAVTLATIAVLSFALVLGTYLGLLFANGQEGFLAGYWERQMSGRFLSNFNTADLFLVEFWWPLLKDSYFLLALTPFAFLSKHSNKTLLIGGPLVFLASFVLAFAPTHRFGGQYVAIMLPAIAWLVAVAIESKVKYYDKLLFASGNIAVICAIALQYSGISLRKSAPGTDLLFLKELSQKKNALHYYDPYPEKPNFISASRLAWYTKSRVVYPKEQIPVAQKNHFYFYSNGNSPASLERINILKENGWCPVFTNPTTRIFTPCDTQG